MASISKTGRWVVVLALLGAVVLVASVFVTVMLGKNERPVGEYGEKWTSGPARYEVEINGVDGHPAVMAGKVDGHEIRVRCDTCHAGKEPNRKTASGKDLKDFHKGLVFEHGGGALSCLACHNADDYETLRKPDGTIVPFSRAMELCAQCHGPQYRDYLGGSHGGMTGYWDLQRGKRTRNSCLDCHDVHSPSFKQMIPMPPPKTRSGTMDDAGRGSHH